MNILISRGNGKGFDFDNLTPMNKLYGGIDNNSALMLKLAETYPEHMFYFVGRSDLDKCKIKPDNLINLESLVNTYKINTYGRKSVVPKYKPYIEYIDSIGLKFDKAIIKYTQTCTFAEYDKGYISERTGTPRKLLVMEQSLTSIYMIIKTQDLPTIFVLDDIRQMDHIPSDLNYNKINIMCQCVGNDHSKYYTSIDKKEEKQIPYMFEPIDKFFFLYKTKVDWRNINKTNNFMMAVNGSADRYKTLKKWVFPYDDNVKIYGMWTNNTDLWNKINKECNAYRFEAKGMCDMQDDLLNTKYSFVMGMAKGRTNLITQKVYSMIYYGIIPFWCKTEYDTDNTFTEIPDYLKVETPQEMWDKINELNSNENKYNEIKSQLWNCLSDDYFNNNLIHNIFDKVIYE